jgi:hypothetical protein
MVNECEVPKGVKKLAIKKTEAKEECVKEWKDKGIDVVELEDDEQ